MLVKFYWSNILVNTLVKYIGQMYWSNVWSMYFKFIGQIYWSSILISNGLKNMLVKQRGPQVTCLEWGTLLHIDDCSFASDGRSQSTQRERAREGASER